MGLGYTVFVYNGTFKAELLYHHLMTLYNEGLNSELLTKDEENRVKTEYVLCVHHGTFKVKLLSTDREADEYENKTPKKLKRQEDDTFENNLCQKTDFFYNTSSWWNLDRPQNFHIKLILNNHGYPDVYLVQKDWVIDHFGFDEIENSVQYPALRHGDNTMKNRFHKKPKHKIDIIVLLLLIRNTSPIWNQCISIDVLRNHIIPYCFFDDVVLVLFCDKD